MRLAPPIIALLGLAGGLWAGALSRADERQTVILTGDFAGYLSPCGCSEPMLGGIRRMASEVRRLSSGHPTTLVSNGNLVNGIGRQDEMKAETAAQALADLRAGAINVGAADARLGANAVTQVAQLSGNRLVSLSIGAPEGLGVSTTAASGPFLIGGASEAPAEVAGALGRTAVPLAEGVRALVEQAAASGLKPMLLLAGGHGTAERLARDFPDLVLIQYSSVGDPPRHLEKVGNTVLATTGERGKHLVRMVYGPEGFEDYSVVALAPTIRDDPAVSRFYATYLQRVASEKLLDKLPRVSGSPYAGSWACSGCHRTAMRVWKSSAHRTAFATLVREGHQADPDCVGCHVVGLDRTAGFRSLAATPHLAGVGCESCHGPSLDHVKKPSQFRLGVKSCRQCHNPENSPNFDFDRYWPKIAHR